MYLLDDPDTGVTVYPDSNGWGDDFEGKSDWGDMTKIATWAFFFPLYNLDYPLKIIHGFRQWEKVNCHQHGASASAIPFIISVLNNV
jgi:hypothetical protein